MAPEFDNKSYDRFVKVHTDMTYVQQYCGSASVYQILTGVKYDTAHLVTYTKNLRNNDEVARIAEIVDGDVQEMLDRENMSKTYCELKTKQLLIKIDEALDSIGNLY